MILKKIAFVLCVLCLLLSSCNIENVGLEYKFYNKTEFTIKITLIEPYKTDANDERSKTSPFLVENMNVTKVYVQNNGIVHFQWTTDSAEDNSKVYCVTEGQKATFRNVKERI
jgi:hypothetical protein